MGDRFPPARVRPEGDRGYSGRGYSGRGYSASGSGSGGRFDIEGWRARVTDRLLIAVAVMGAVALTSSVVQAVREPGWWGQTLPFVAAYAFVLALTLLRGRLSWRVRAWGLLLVGYLAATMYLAILGLLGNGVVFLLGLPAMGLIILGVRSGVLMAVLSAGLYLVFMVAAWTGVMADWLIIRENTLAVSQWLSQGLSFGVILVALVVMLAMFNRAQEEALVETEDAAAELAMAHGELAASSAELDGYTRLLETAAGISYDIIAHDIIASEISAVLAREDLLRRAVDLIWSRLKLRGVAVYLVEPGSDRPVLGPAVGEGAATAAGEMAGAAAGGLAVPQVVAEVVRASQEGAGMAGAGREVGLPLRVGTRLLGVLHVVSPAEGVLTEREVQSLQVMADQLAVALENARLFGEVQGRLDELNALQRQYTTEAWTRFVGDRPRPEYLWQPAGKPGDAAWLETLNKVRVSAGVTSSEVTGPVTGFDEETGQHVVAAPVRLRETVIGVLAFHRPRDAGAWQREEVAAIEAVGSRLAFAAENLRLLEQTQRRAARERVVDQITRRMQASLDPETIMKVAVRELGRALGASQAVVELGPGAPGPGRVPVPEVRPESPSPELSGGNGGTVEG